MSDWIDFGENLRIPFIFVPHGQPESSEAAAFKARYPDWFSIPATFVPHSEARRPANEALLPGYVERRLPSDEEASFPPPPITDRRLLRQGEAGSSLRAFQRASALHGDPVAALRALRDSPEAFADGPPAVQTAQAVPLPGLKPPPFGGSGSDLDDAARRLSNAIMRILHNERPDAEPATPSEPSRETSVEELVGSSSPGQATKGPTT